MNRPEVQNKGPGSGTNNKRGMSHKGIMVDIRAAKRDEAHNRNALTPDNRRRNGVKRRKAKK